jgi:hypothetical protein
MKTKKALGKFNNGVYKLTHQDGSAAVLKVSKMLKGNYYFQTPFYTQNIIRSIASNCKVAFNQKGEPYITSESSGENEFNLDLIENKRIKLGGKDEKLVITKFSQQDDKYNELSEKNTEMICLKNEYFECGDMKNVNYTLTKDKKMEVFDICSEKIRITNQNSLKEMAKINIGNKDRVCEINETVDKAGVTLQNSKSEYAFDLINEITKDDKFKNAKCYKSDKNLLTKDIIKMLEISSKHMGFGRRDAAINEFAEYSNPTTMKAPEFKYDSSKKTTRSEQLQYFLNENSGRLELMVHLSSCLQKQMKENEITSPINNQVGYSSWRFGEEVGKRLGQKFIKK